jgi:hypothetical protein
MSKPLNEAFEEISELIDEHEDFFSEDEWQSLLRRIVAHVKDKLN